MTNYITNETVNRELVFKGDELKKFLNEYVRASAWDRFTGFTDNNPIIVRGPNRSVGENATFRQHRSDDIKIITEYDPRPNHASSFSAVIEKVPAEIWSFAVLVTQFHSVEVQTGDELLKLMRPDLLKKFSKAKDRQILSQFGKAFCRVNPPPLNVLSPDLINILKAKMLECGIDNPGPTGESISSNRLVVGTMANTPLAPTVTTINQLLTAAAMGGGGLGNHTMSTNHIIKAGQLATLGYRTGISFKEEPLTPWQISMKQKYFDERIPFLISPSAYEKLLADPKWLAQVSRGYNQPDQPDAIFGTDYKGTFDGKMIIVVPALEEYIIDKGAEGRFAYSVLFAPGSIGYHIAKYPWFFEEWLNSGLGKQITQHQISGMKVLKYPSQGPNKNLYVEHGIIHSFTAL